MSWEQANSDIKEKTQQETSKSTTKECQSCQIWTHSTHTEETKKRKGDGKTSPFLSNKNPKNRECGKLEFSTLSTGFQQQVAQRNSS